jgi:hypothetical protein
VTPQSAFLVLAPVREGARESLTALLDTMNAQPGRANPTNSIIPFGQFERLHFARVCLIDDNTAADVAAYRLPRRAYPLYLAIVGDVDDDAESFLAELAAVAGDGLRRLFSHCDGFDSNGSLLEWLKGNSAPAAAAYVNWKGRTMLQVREEAAIFDAVECYLDQNASAVAPLEPVELHGRLRNFLSGEIAAARLTMTPAAPTRLGWWIGNAVGAVLPVLVAIVLSPLLLIVGAILLVLARIAESSDPEICPPVDPSYRQRIATTEDRDVTNAFSAVGSLKPGLVRLAIALLGLQILRYAASHIYTVGRLARVRTIHFARWVWIDGHQRLAFMSNYDGSLESYMDDFINKAGFGLNFVFSNGIGYPSTRWLVAGGCKDEQKFKNYLHRHQFDTQVWYNAHPGLTAAELERNARIRTGLEAETLSEAEARAWAALL